MSTCRRSLGARDGPRSGRRGLRMECEEAKRRDRPTTERAKKRNRTERQTREREADKSARGSEREGERKGGEKEEHKRKREKAKQRARARKRGVSALRPSRWMSRLPSFASCSAACTPAHQVSVLAYPSP
eukprot:1859524-Rhodomonas_salina.2